MRTTPNGDRTFTQVLTLLKPKKQGARVRVGYT
jgi:hypothetical protein